MVPTILPSTSSSCGPSPSLLPTDASLSNPRTPTNNTTGITARGAILLSFRHHHQHYNNNKRASATSHDYYYDNDSIATVPLQQLQNQAAKRHCGSQRVLSTVVNHKKTKQQVRFAPDDTYIQDEMIPSTDDTTKNNNEEDSSTTTTTWYNDDDYALFQIDIQRTVRAAQQALATTGTLSSLNKDQYTIRGLEQSVIGLLMWK